MNSRAPLPAFSVIERALRTTTEVLAREIVHPTPETPAWNEFEWVVARAVCAMHGLATLLADRLQWRAPPSWNSFLRDQREQSRAHYDVASKVLGTLDSAARNAGIACIALKGSALRALGVHAPGERPMGDIDVLVRRRDTDGCTAMLAQMGYEPAYSLRRHLVFAPVEPHEAHPFAEDARNPLKIELHTHIAECLPASAVDITGELWPAHVLPGINGYRSRAALLKHLLLHAAGNMRAHVLRFIQLYDIARLARTLQPEDWRELHGHPDSRTDAWWIYPPLVLAARYLPGNITADVLASFRSVCPPRLRAHADRFELYEVSWSNLRIAALPGSEWARTPLELLRFAKSRVVPGRAALRDLSVAQQAHPAISQLRWYGVTHGERILRWLISRPPRVQTMVSVRAAFEAASAER